MGFITDYVDPVCFFLWKSKFMQRPSDGTCTPLLLLIVGGSADPNDA